MNDPEPTTAARGYQPTDRGTRCAACYKRIEPGAGSSRLGDFAYHPDCVPADVPTREHLQLQATMNIVDAIDRIADREFIQAGDAERVASLNWENAELRERLDSAAGLLMNAWGVIANAYGGNWKLADKITNEDWRPAAEAWRDAWHKFTGPTEEMPEAPPEPYAESDKPLPVAQGVAVPVAEAAPAVAAPMTEEAPPESSEDQDAPL